MRRAVRAIATSILAASVLVGCGRGESRVVERPDPLDLLPAGGRAPRTLSIGLTPGAGVAESLVRTAPLEEFLERRLRMAVRLRAAETYGDLARMVARGEVHVGLFAPAGWVEQRDRLPVVPIASATRNGAPTYVGYLVVRDAGRFPTLGSLRGSRIAWVDRGSAAGYLFPRALLRFRGLDPAAFFSEEIFAGDHPSALRMVLEGRADVAAIASSFIDAGAAERLAGASEVEVVAKSERIPYDCVGIRRDLPRSLARRVRDALLSLHADHRTSRALRETSGIDGFIPSDESRYDRVARIHTAR